MPKINLQDIRDAADRKYGPTVIDDVDGGPVTLANPLKLSKAKRKKLSELDAQEGLEADDKLTETIKLAASPADAKRLLAAIGDDLPTLAQIVTEWGKSAQVGEASPSAS